MKLRSDVVQCMLAMAVGVQMIADAMGKMAPFLRNAIQTSLPVKTSSSGLMLKIPTRDLDMYRLKPRRKHLKTHKLMKRLSSEFDKDYMSITKPEVGNREMVVRQADDKLYSTVRDVNLNLTDASGNQIVLDTSTTQALKSWLVNRASCPVAFRWEDLGIFFWPRWVKRGFCVNEPSCSWPPGMHCIPAHLKELKILWWHCKRLWRSTKGRGRRPKKGGKTDNSNDTENWPKQTKGRRGKLSKRCKWVKVPYQVTNQCYCSC